MREGLSLLSPSSLRRYELGLKVPESDGGAVVLLPVFGV